MNAREEILARVRAGLAGSPAPAPAQRDYRRAGPSDPARLVDQLTDRLLDYRARVHQPAAAELPATLARLLAGAALLVTPADAAPQWRAAYPGAARTDPPPIPLADLDAPGVWVLTGCAVAIAETGTIILDAGPGQGRRALTLVPDHHVCVVRPDQIVATVPEGLARLPDPTRPLTLISGPSATSDIELNRVEGVHGPRHLEVIIPR